MSCKGQLYFASLRQTVRKCDFLTASGKQRPKTVSANITVLSLINRSGQELRGVRIVNYFFALGFACHVMALSQTLTGTNPGPLQSSVCYQQGSTRADLSWSGKACGKCMWFGSIAVSSTFHSPNSNIRATNDTLSVCGGLNILCLFWGLTGFRLKYFRFQQMSSHVIHGGLWSGRLQRQSSDINCTHKSCSIAWTARITVSWGVGGGPFRLGYLPAALTFSVFDTPSVGQACGWYLCAILHDNPQDRQTTARGMDPTQRQMARTARL